MSHVGAPAPPSSWLSSLIGDYLGSIGRLLEAPQLGELVEWWWQNSASLQFATVSSRNVANFVGPWGASGSWSDELTPLANTTLEPAALGKSLAHSLLCRSDSQGSDVRLDLGTVFRCKAWPRMSISADKLRWYQLLAYPFERGQHINELELLAFLSLLKWKARSASKHGLRCLALNDNQVVVSIVAKGRCSSIRLSRILRRVSALTLATFSQPCIGYVRSADNPADTGSRLWEKKW